MEYVVPLDPDLKEEAMEQIRKTEDTGNPIPKQTTLVGKCVRHLVFGEGTIIGIPRDREGIIVQFDSVPTPRTFGPAVKLEYLS